MPPRSLRVITSASDAPARAVNSCYSLTQTFFENLPFIFYSVYIRMDPDGQVDVQVQL